MSELADDIQQKYPVACQTADDYAHDGSLESIFRFANNELVNLESSDAQLLEKEFIAACQDGLDGNWQYPGDYGDYPQPFLATLGYYSIDAIASFFKHADVSSCAQYDPWFVYFQLRSKKEQDVAQLFEHLESAETKAVLFPGLDIPRSFLKEAWPYTDGDAWSSLVASLQVVQLHRSASRIFQKPVEHVSEAESQVTSCLLKLARNAKLSTSTLQAIGVDLRQQSAEDRAATVQKLKGTSANVLKAVVAALPAVTLADLLQVATSAEVQKGAASRRKL